MDLLKKQNEPNSERTKKILTLEARHTKCLEAYKNISRKLSPKLFIPRRPYVDKKSLQSEKYRSWRTNHTKMGKNFVNYKQVVTNSKHASTSFSNSHKKLTPKEYAIKCWNKKFNLNTGECVKLSKNDCKVVKRKNIQKLNKGKTFKNFKNLQSTKLIEELSNLTTTKRETLKTTAAKENPKKIICKTIKDEERAHQALSTLTFEQNRTNLDYKETKTENTNFLQSIDKREKLSIDQVIENKASVEKELYLMDKEEEKSKTYQKSFETKIREKYLSDSGLQTIKTEITNFQNAICSTMTSPLDETIKNNLLSLHSCVHEFSELVLQVYKDLDEKEAETNNQLEYLRRKNMKPHLERYSPHARNECKNTENTADTADTYTIYIEAETLPKKSITFKIADTLNSIQMSNGPFQESRISKVLEEKSKQAPQPITSTFKVPTLATRNCTVLPDKNPTQNQVKNTPTKIMQHLKKSSQNMNKMKNKEKLFRYNPSHSNTQIPTSTTAAIANFTNSYNVPYTSDQMPYNNYYIEDFFRNYGPPGNSFINHHSNNSINNRAIAENNIALAMNYNYPHSTQFHNNSQFPAPYECYATNLNPPLQTFNRAPNERTNEHHRSLMPTPIFQNYYL